MLPMNMIRKDLCILECIYPSKQKAHLTSICKDTMTSVIVFRQEWPWQIAIRQQFFLLPYCHKKAMSWNIPKAMTLTPSPQSMKSVATRKQHPSLFIIKGNIMSLYLKHVKSRNSQWENTLRKQDKAWDMLKMGHGLTRQYWNITSIQKSNSFTIIRHSWLSFLAIFIAVRAWVLSSVVSKIRKQCSSQPSKSNDCHLLLW